MFAPFPMPRLKALRRRQALAALPFAFATTAGATPPAFEVTEIRGDGRTVAAELADCNGDRRGDVVEVVFRGHPPNEERLLRTYLQAADGSLPAQPSHEQALPPGTAAYDIIRGSGGGCAMAFLRQRDIAIVTPGGGAPRLLRLPGASSVGAAADERGLERLEIVSDRLAAEPRLVVLQLGEVTVLSLDGEILGRLEAGGLANFLVPMRPGLLFFESDVRLLFDAPRISIGDVDGDGAADIVTSTRHDLRVFLQGPGGRFDPRPQRVYPLNLVAESDHIRGSGGVTAQVADLTGDGRADLILAHQSGGLTDARLITRIYRNEDGGWQIDKPVRTLDSSGAIGSEFALDLDGDGRAELIRVIVPFSTMGLVRTLLTRTIQAEARIYPPDRSSGLGDEPVVSFDLDVPFSFDTLRSSGFLPNWSVDVNGDGHLDLLLSGGGKQFDVHLGGPRFGYKKRQSRTKIPTQGVLRSGDLDGDGIPDFVIFDPFTNGAPVQVLRNLATLPGSPARIGAAERPADGALQ